MAISTISNDIRAASLRTLLGTGRLCRIIEVHSPLAGIIAEHARGGAANERNFDGFWSSSLTDSALRGLPDSEVLNTHLRLAWIDAIFSVTTKPLVMDGDTGGSPSHFSHAVQVMERGGVSAVVIEDKTGDKRNSLLPGDSLHQMAPVEDFCAKIAAGKAAQVGVDFMIFARLEGLIAGLSTEEVVARADAYVRAGADGVVVHSRSSDAALVIDLAQRIRAIHPQVPLVAIPTAYPSITEDELAAAGFNLVIYANQMLRSSVKAMEEVSHRILDSARALEAEDVCIRTAQILSMRDDETPLVRVRTER